MAAAVDKRRARPVRIGTQAVGGDGPPIVISDEGQPDARWLGLRRHHGRADADALLAEARADWAGPLLVEPFGAPDLPAIAAHADGLIVGADWMQDFRLVRAAAAVGLPMIVCRGPASTFGEWLGVAEYCVAEGNDQLILCESGSRTAQNTATTLDLGMMRTARERSGRPVLASAEPGLAGAAVAAGADGLLMSGPPAEGLEAVAALGAIVRRERPRSILAARGAIDRVDAAIATLLERRVELAGTVQRLKPVAGLRGRDPGREQQIARRMAERAPTLGEERLRTIMNAVIEAGLDVHEGVSGARR